MESSGCWVLFSMAKNNDFVREVTDVIDLLKYWRGVVLGGKTQSYSPLFVSYNYIANNKKDYHHVFFVRVKVKKPNFSSEAKQV